MKKLLRRHGDEFMKYHGSWVEEDWRQVNILADLTKSIPNVRTAEPLRLDLEKECIWYEWLGELPSLITLKGGKLDEMVFRTGTALAKIHAASADMPAYSDISPDSRFPLGMFGVDKSDDRKISNKLPVGFFHGDCWHGNVHFDSQEECVLIDPVQSPWLFGSQRFVCASGIVDLATMHMSLLVSLRIMKLLSISIEKQLAVGEILLESYLKHFDAMSLRREAFRLSNAIAKKYVSTYPVRINVLVGWVKQGLSKRVISSAEEKGLN
jgi:hypothetical protein